MPSAAARVSPRRGRALDPVLALTAVLVGVPFLLRLRLLRIRGFGPDEFEHLHFAWCISRGLVPYRDYFEHHTPWLHHAMAPLLLLFDVDRRPEHAVHAIVLARIVMWVFAGLTLVFTFLLGRSMGGPRVGALATLLLANSAFFLSKSLEFRPDVPAAALLLGALWLGARGLARQDGGAPGATRQMALAGVLLGSATMLTQKVLFVLPGLAVAALAWTWRPRPASRRDRVRAVAAAALGFAVPCGLTAAYFAGRGALWPFLYDNFLLNAGWKGLPPGGFLRELASEDLALSALGAAGLLKALADLRLAPFPARTGLVALASLSLWLALLVHPAVTRHYFLLPLPPLAILAAATLVRLARALPARSVTPTLLVAAAALSVPPLLRFRAAFDRRNDGTLERIRWVVGNTAPWEPVLDGFTGLGVFRPHVGFHAFQHKDALAVQGDGEERALADGLRGGRLMPRLIFWNHYLREGVPAGLEPFLLDNYAEVGLYPIRARLFDNGAGWWTDEGPRRVGWMPEGVREPHLYVGDGWQRPQGKGLGRRRTAGASAELLLPVREPGGFRLSVRAWGGPDAPCGLRVALNDRAPPAAVCVQRGWRSYSFDVPAESFRSGMNAVRLGYPCPASCGGDPDWGRGRWLLVETVALQRLPPP